MAQNRVFFPQEALDGFIEQGRIALVGDELTANPEARSFQLESAVRFMTEVASGEDPHGLIGKVKSMAQVQELGGEHAPGSVIVGDNAYEVIDGFLGELQPGTGRKRKTSGAWPEDALARLLGVRSTS